MWPVQLEREGAGSRRARPGLCETRLAIPRARRYLGAQGGLTSWGSKLMGGLPCLFLTCSLFTFLSIPSIPSPGLAFPPRSLHFFLFPSSRCIRFMCLCVCVRARAGSCVCTPGCTQNLNSHMIHIRMRMRARQPFFCRFQRARSKRTRVIRARSTLPNYRFP